MAKQFGTSIDMLLNKITNLAVATTGGDAVRYSQLQQYGMNDNVTAWTTLSTSVANETQILQLSDGGSTIIDLSKFIGIWEAEYAFQNTLNVGRIQFAVDGDGGTGIWLNILSNNAPNTCQIGVKANSIAFFTDTVVVVGYTTWKMRRLFGLSPANTFTLSGTKITSTLLASGYDTSLPDGGTVVKDIYSTSSTLKVKKIASGMVQFIGVVQNPLVATYPTTQGTVPLGYRPSSNRYVQVILSNPGGYSSMFLTISSAGVITKSAGGTFSYTSYLDGVCYSL